MSSPVRIDGLTKRFEGKPPTVAVDELDLEIAEGELLVLLGPSGCGKTTTLRCLAGLESPTEGVISYGGQTVFDPARRIDLAPDKRNIGMVFQSYALWPHMTVRKNIGYPLRARRIKEGIAGGWVEETAELVDCGNLLDRLPGQLSGGQQQRVALARGIVARPEVVLFDEPLSNLDARLRDQVRSELHELHRRLGFTAVYVTHDQSEALALGDRLAIMRSGRLEQLGTPEDVFESPVSEYVADFIGMSNRLPLERVGDAWFVDGQPVEGAVGRGEPAGAAVARLRPDNLCIWPAGAVVPPGMAHVTGTVVDATYGGRHVDVTASIGTTRTFARIPTSGSDEWIRTVQPGERAAVGFRWADAALYGEGGQPLDIRPDRSADVAASVRP